MSAHSCDSSSDSESETDYDESTAQGLQPYMFEPEADSSRMCTSATAVSFTANRSSQPVNKWCVLFAY